jgi:hypothetical protein
MSDKPLFAVVRPELYAQIEEEARKIDPLFDVRRRLNEPLRSGSVLIFKQQPLPKI